MRGDVQPMAGGDAADVLGWAIDVLTPNELARHIAIAAGKLAFQRGDEHAFKVLCRVAGALGHQHQGRA